jgi:hydrogenase maturation protease
VTGRVLVAGIGNIFLGDDGFGPEVVRRMPSAPEESVRIVDYGIRGMHLAYDLLEDWAALVLVDAVPNRGEPGRIDIIRAEPDPGRSTEPDPHAPATRDAQGTHENAHNTTEPNAHSTAANAPGTTERDTRGTATNALGTTGLDTHSTTADTPGTTGLDAHSMDPVAVFASVRALGGVVPPTIVVGCQVCSTEEGIGLSDPVAAAVDPAVEAVRQVVTELRAQRVEV